jgi:hypothetical protein
MAKKLTPVATELDKETLRRLDEKRAESERSRAAEIRMALRAWLGSNGEAAATDRAAA